MNILKVKQPDGTIITIPLGKGADGHTPVKGIDYFTDEDKNEIITEIKAYTDAELEPVETLLGNVRNKVLLNSQSVAEMRIQIGDLQVADDATLQKAKTYTDEEIAKFDFIKVVDSLPDVGLPNKVYFVPKADTQTQDLFDEYAWVNKGTTEAPNYAWEWITTKQLEVDLTNYATTTALNDAIRARSEIEHPVGSIYISIKSTNPVNIFGFGTWVRIKDRFLLGVGDTYTEVSKTGGSATVALSTTQVPKVEGQIGIHGGTTATNIHTTQGCFKAGITNTNKYINTGTGTTGADSIGQIRFSNGGTGAAHNNMPPYYTVYIWLRTD